MTPRLTVVGSVNLDLVARTPALPRPGQTVTGAMLARHPGGKGANQALAARRLGAEVALVARVGPDSLAEEALSLLRAEGVDLARVEVDPDAPTGVALIAVDPHGENQIVVASGANGTFLLSDLSCARHGDALLCQLELPIPTVAAAVASASGLVALNLAPALDVPDAVLARADLLVANEGEAAVFGDRLHKRPGLTAVTYSAAGARLFRRGQPVADAFPPTVKVVDTTGAGDAFVAALLIALLEGRPEPDALAFACAAGALATTREGAQPALPYRAEVDRAHAAGRHLGRD